MPLINKGIYIDMGDKAFEAKTSYYLQFQIKQCVNIN